jgi:hypothetical protein
MRDTPQKGPRMSASQNVGLGPLEKCHQLECALSLAQLTSYSSQQILMIFVVLSRSPQH